MDLNSDGQIEEEELREHINFMQKRYVNNDVERTWKHYKEEQLKDGRLKWDDYRCEQKKSVGLDFYNVLRLLHILQNFLHHACVRFLHLTRLTLEAAILSIEAAYQVGEALACERFKCSPQLS
jgi:hypothetical protein